MPVRIPISFLVRGAAAIVLFAGSARPAKAAVLPPPAARAVDYARDVQPIFESSCYTCHGPKKQEAGLRLDDKASALKGGDSGPVILPGKSGESLLVRAIAGVKDDLVMPKKGDRLTPGQIGLIRGWIDQGAIWPEGRDSAGKAVHWAFKAPVRPVVPSIKNKRWARNPIDQFVAARLEKEKLKPSSEADKVALLRRASLDLIGLPPTLEEVDAFLADKGTDALERQVERLLKSPHYGERWGRQWLDAARYADSDGYEKDKSRNVWFYRDYVIHALNNDLPYDRFIIEQLAGDLLPNATQEQIVATGFLRHSMLNEEGGVDPEQFRMDAMFDRMDAIGKSVLGLTIQCAQCHNHKYDPLTQEEYYRLFAFINNDHEPTRVVYSSDEAMKRDALVRDLREIEEGIRRNHPNWRERMAQWESEVSGNQPEWIVVQPVVEEITTGGQRYLPQADGSFLAQGYAPTKHTVRLWLTNDLVQVTAFRLELLTDPNLPCDGPGRSYKGTCALTEFNIEAAPLNAPTNKTKIKFASATSDFDPPQSKLEASFYDKSTNNRITGPIAYAIDGNNNTAWGTDAGPGRRNQERKAVFQCSTHAGFPGGTIYSLNIAQNHGGWNSDEHMNNNLGRFRFSVTRNPSPVVADPVPKRVRDIFAVPRGKRTASQEAEVFHYWRTTVPDFKADNDRIEALWKEWPSGSTALTLMAREELRETHILRRGDFLKPARAVTPGVPSFLHPLPEGAPPTRLTFARWLVDRRSPTTARVIVNRVWQSYFGQGLVNTPEDFGTQCDAPSNPELLDWLACEFMDGGWSLKKLHRLITSSATYRESSKVTPELYERDPYNRLLARGPRFRVEAEIVRDIALSSSGLLTSTVGGPSVFSPAPPFLFLPPASYAPFTWDEATGPDRYRRALYTFRRRSTPYPALQAFDAPNGDFSCVRRLRSNTPIQALVTLNEPVYMECAQALARIAMEHGGRNEGDRVVYAFRRVLSRPPSAYEQRQLLELLHRQSDRLLAMPTNAIQLTAVPTGVSSTPPAMTSPAQLAAYTVVCRVILNLDETITKQ